MGCCFTVPQSTMALMENCGEYTGTASPGCHCIVPWVSVAGRMSMRLQEHACQIESKTKDNVFVTVRLVLQYQVLPEKVEAAFYTLSDPVQQIEAYVFNSIRGKIPLYRLEALFLERSTIAAQLKEEVDEKLERFGFDIVGALITEINPGADITNAMNSVQKYQRLRVAGVDQAETAKLKRVRAAEAYCESKRLSGEGLAQQRMAIVEGLQQSIEEFQRDLPATTSQEAMKLLLMNQYFDTLKEVAAKSTQGSVLFLDTTGGLDELEKQLSITRHAPAAPTVPIRQTSA